MCRRRKVPVTPPPHDPSVPGRAERPRRADRFRHSRPPRRHSRVMLLFALIGVIAVLFLLVKYAVIPVLVLVNK